MTLPVGLMDVLKAEYALEWNGVHGPSHWARVRENGLLLAQAHRVNPELVELFAFLHDVKRQNNAIDPGHGQRAADFAGTLEPSLIPLNDAELELLTFACARHTDGLTVGDIAVQVCWDADRLDLGRVGIRPEPKYLCTATAKRPDIIEWALRRSEIARAQHRKGHPRQPE